MKRNDKTMEYQNLPCGQCPNCMARRTSGWSFRLMMEDRRAISSSFITLTYDTDHVPLSRNGFMDLSKRDLQLFFKRLRKDSLNNGRQIKYYAVGEYGTKGRRPHYHIILFNADVESVSHAWSAGSIYYGSVSGASVGYTLKYLSKPRKNPMHRNDDRSREFCLMSKRLGENYIGKSMRFYCGEYIDDPTDPGNQIIEIKKRTKFVSLAQVVKWHHQDLSNSMYCTTFDGKKIAMPRYFKEKIYQGGTRKAVAFWAKKRMEEIEAFEALHDKIPTEQDRALSVKAAFNKMHHRALTGTSKF